MRKARQRPWLRGKWNNSQEKLTAKVLRRRIIGAETMDALVQIRIPEDIGSMTQKHSTPQLTAREYKDGRGWYVESTGDASLAENVGDFASASEAEDWIIRKSTAYFKARQK
jgi:hypothetical protein